MDTAEAARLRWAHTNYTVVTCEWCGAPVGSRQPKQRRFCSRHRAKRNRTGKGETFITPPVSLSWATSN